MNFQTMFNLAIYEILIALLIGEENEWKEKQKEFMKNVLKLMFIDDLYQDENKLYFIILEETEVYDGISEYLTKKYIILSDECFELLIQKEYLK